MNEISLGIKTKLPKTYLWFVFIKMILLFLLISLPFFLVHFWLGMFWLILIIIGIPVMITIFINYKNTSFILEKGKITIYWGIITKKSSTIPFNNIQNVETSSGLLARMFGIAKVSIWTASPSQIEVHRGESENKPDQFLFLKTKDAEFLKSFVLTK
jgi:uncharacterized membrane protein YdbT with pleckstrin-like domain